MRNERSGREEEPDNPDADERMFHACFSILGDFVENELGTNSQDYDKGQSHFYRGYRLHTVKIGTKQRSISGSGTVTLYPEKRICAATTSPPQRIMAAQEPSSHYSGRSRPFSAF